MSRKTHRGDIRRNWPKLYSKTMFSLEMTSILSSQFLKRCDITFSFLKVLSCGQLTATSNVLVSPPPNLLYNIVTYNIVTGASRVALWNSKLNLLLKI